MEKHIIVSILLMELILKNIICWNYIYLLFLCYFKMYNYVILNLVDINIYLLYVLF